MYYCLVPTYLLAFGLFGCGVLLASWCKISRWKFLLLVAFGSIAAVPGIAFSLYYLKVFREVPFFYEFRSWPYTELSASGAGLLAGFLHGRYSPSTRFRRIAGRWFFPGMLFIGLFIPYFKPIVLAARYDQLQDRWSEEICLQSSDSSCGPACAATLLAVSGKRVSEQELARTCFTSKTSTESWYLARALRERGLKVRFVIEKDPSKPWPYPAIAGVRLPSSGNIGHFVTVLGRTNDTYIIGDPLEGKLLLQAPAALEKYTFTGLFMVIE